MLFRIIILSAAFALLLTSASAQTARGKRADRKPVDPRGKVRFPSDTMGYGSTQLPAGAVRYGSPQYYQDSASLNSSAMPMQQQYNAGQYQREGQADTPGRTGINTANPAGTQPMGTQPPAGSSMQQQQPSGVNVGTGSGVQRPGDVGQSPAGSTGSLPADARNQPSGLNAPSGHTTQPASDRPAGVATPNPDGTSNSMNPATGAGVNSTGAGQPSRPTPAPVDSSRAPRK